MADGAYSALYRSYDRLNSETDYAAWAEFLRECFKRFGKSDTRLVLDLGCGTGAMTFALRALGYDMTAIDISPDMLSVASEAAYEKEVTDILWLCQDMRSFELYGTVDAIVCALDGINHLTGEGDLKKTLRLVNNYLENGGVFVFDVNTPHKFETFYADNDYILEDSGVMCCWQNSYDGETKLCDFYLSVFEETPDGKWTREDVVQRERCYTEKELTDAITDAGLEVSGIFSDFSFGRADDADRWYIVARKAQKS